MKNENLKLLVAAATGAIGGLLLGMFLWGREEKKSNLSSKLSSLSDIVHELENLNTREANELKDQIRNILSGVEDLLDRKEEKDG